MIIRIVAIVISLLALGMVLYIMLGKNQKPWNQMSDEEQKRKKTLVTGGIIVFLSGLLAAIFLGKKK